MPWGDDDESDDDIAPIQPKALVALEPTSGDQDPVENEIANMEISNKRNDDDKRNVRSDNKIQRRDDNKFDPSEVAGPPFTVFVFNLNYQVDHKQLVDLFCKNLTYFSIFVEPALILFFHHLIFH